ncbi:hypothetical protein NSS79_34150 [Paenibacillus sp. FSL L8-0436]|uniref:hypothetical protein n=1 Tax=Paenibacillus sp. FSL L8-0436 TaxID=2954686 RepID=UPI0031597F2E
MAQTFEIGYARDCRTGNFIVTKIDYAFPANSKYRRQQICVLPGAFFRALPSIDRRSVANVIEITANQAHELGFIVRVETEVAAHEVCA